MKLLIYLINTESKKWSIVLTTERVKGRKGHAAVVYDDVMAIHGGKGRDSPLSSIHLFNFSMLSVVLCCGVLCGCVVLCCVVCSDKFISIKIQVNGRM